MGSRRGKGVFLWAVTICLLCSVSAGAYWYEMTAREDGHLKLWWTKNGVRISPDPFMDTDGVRTGDSFYLVAPTKDINDCDSWWRRKSGKTSGTVAYTGMGYPLPTFEAYFAGYPSPTTWFSLADMAELDDVQVSVDLLVWGDYLRVQPLPSPAMVYPFDATGHCPMLPGYQALRAPEMLPFDGLMVVVGVHSLYAYIPGDINRDGYVNVGDLQMLVAEWGLGPHHPGPADINRDGYVNVGDLQMLVACWGRSAT